MTAGVKSSLFVIYVELIRYPHDCRGQVLTLCYICGAYQISSWLQGSSPHSLLYMWSLSDILMTAGVWSSLFVIYVELIRYPHDCRGQVLTLCYICGAYQISSWLQGSGPHSLLYMWSLSDILMTAGVKSSLFVIYVELIRYPHDCRGQVLTLCYICGAYQISSWLQGSGPHSLLCMWSSSGLLSITNTPIFLLVGHQGLVLTHC